MNRGFLYLCATVLLAGCGQQSIAPGEASVENAVAAVVVFDTEDPVAANDLANAAFLDPVQGTEMRFAGNLRSFSRKTQGEPSGSIFAQLIFQSWATSEDRQEIASRVEDLGLAAPIWLGPDDRWLFCVEQPCILVEEDGNFP